MPLLCAVSVLMYAFLYRQDRSARNSKAERAIGNPHDTAIPEVLIPTSANTIHETPGEYNPPKVTASDSIPMPEKRQLTTPALERVAARTLTLKSYSSR